MLLKKKKFYLFQNKNMDFQKIFKFFSFFSLLIGILGTIWGLLFWLLPGKIKLNLFGYYDWQLSLYFWIFIPASILGAILGIMAIKLTSGNKKLEIAGIALSLFGLLIWLFIWLLVIGFELEG
jgi:membrane protein DedA with SNARE-associated domain